MAAMNELSLSATSVIPLTDVISVAISVLISFVGLMFGLAKYLLAQSERRQNVKDDALESRLSSIDAALKTANAEWVRIERDLFQLKAQLPVEYVRRDDWVRGQTGIETKLDALAIRLENAILKRAAQ
jgi:hypothetical protein